MTIEKILAPKAKLPSADRYASLKALKKPAAAPNLAAHSAELRSLGNVDSLRGTTPDLPEGSDELAKILGARAQMNQFGEHLALRRWFAESIGCEPPQRVNLPSLRLLVPDAVEDVADPTKWLFLDTETTGLAGGTGTYPFLVGVAWWDAGGLEVEQFFMREHSEEHSVLVALAERLAERPVLVTFNGKSFDWPLLETRYRMTRTIRAPKLRAHLDFLHPARNLWRLRLGSARLTDLERHVLGWNRVDHLASSLIPQIYFDFVRGGHPGPLVPIFHHNQMDLRGLAGLASRTLAILDSPDTHGQDALELFGASRIFERRGERTRARTLYEQSIARQLPEETERAAQRSLARLAKREGDFTAACELWKKMLGNSPEGFEAYEQLAIYYERRAGKPERAAEMMRDALAELRRAKRGGLISDAKHRKHVDRFEQRLGRLTRKPRRTLLEATAAVLPSPVQNEKPAFEKIDDFFGSEKPPGRIAEDENKQKAPPSQTESGVPGKTTAKRSLRAQVGVADLERWG
jgi:uncharacterized protein YprB with RNaseH-like and TPR domain